MNPLVQKMLGKRITGVRYFEGINNLLDISGVELEDGTRISSSEWFVVGPEWGDSVSESDSEAREWNPCPSCREGVFVLDQETASSLWYVCTFCGLHRGTRKVQGPS